MLHERLILLREIQVTKIIKWKPNMKKEKKKEVEPAIHKIVNALLLTVPSV